MDVVFPSLNFLKKVGEKNMNAQIIKVPKVIELTQLSRTTLYDKMNPKSKRYDESFPRPIKLSLNAIGWFEQDIIDWLNSKKS